MQNKIFKGASYDNMDGGKLCLAFPSQLSSDFKILLITKYFSMTKSR